MTKLRKGVLLRSLLDNVSAKRVLMEKEGGVVMLEGAGIVMGLVCVGMMAVFCIPMVVRMLKKPKDPDA